jgi:hypothetical protein
MVYVKNADVQAVIAEQHWDGRFIETEGDFFIFVDANMASLKTDAVLKRRIEYEVDASNLEDIRARATIHYDHPEDFDWKTTRYRTYTRLYVPEGSEFIGITGQDRQDGSRVDVENELGKTVFGVFKSVEPLTSESMTFEYRLPARIADQIRNGEYTLYAQKQAGTDDHGLRFHATFDREVAEMSSSDLVSSSGDRFVEYVTDLKYDRPFHIFLQ